MAKKEGHKYHPPKPRVAVYAGLVAGGAAVTGVTNSNLGNVFTAASGDKIHTLLQNLGKTATESNNAVAAVAPAAVGIVVSIGADKLGVNKVLAKMRLPFRV